MVAKKVSVVIPAYNSEVTIEECVKSIVRTGYAPLQVIVVDDCSTDNTRDIVQNLSNETPDVVHLLALKQNGGPSRARNRGAEQADGEYLFFVDSDTQMMPDTLSNFTLHINETGADALSGIYHPSPLNSGAAPLYKALLNYFTCARHGIFDYEIFNGAVAGIRKDVYEKVGGYNESLDWGLDYENEEFGQRVAASFSIKMDPSIQVRHHFDGVGKMTRLYFHRVSLWMEMFLKRKSFETNALGSAPSGLSTVGGTLFQVFLLGALFIDPWLAAPATIFFGLYLYWYFGFLKFVVGKHLHFFPTAVILNLWFCNVLSSGACYGVIRSLFGGGRVVWSQPKGHS
jgi:glycosyltransferase involved in cell wall biosynthesis